MNDEIKKQYRSAFFRMKVMKWNKIIYGQDSPNEDPILGPEELWDKFKIKSYPKFEYETSYRIPNSWAKDVEDFIYDVQFILGNKIDLSQIKEKFCVLTVYYGADGDWAKIEMERLINECIQKLINKGLHPKDRL